MPEGHTIHRLARELDDAFGGRVVAASSPQGRFARGAAIVDGTVLETAEAHGKHLFVRFAGERWIHVHLGLFGIFVVVPAPPPDSVVGEVRLRLAADTAYADLRGPTACDLVTPQERATLYARLGPDPLRGDDPSAALARLGRSRTAIGTALLDQAVFAGVGNVYRAEVLFRAGIDPATESRRLGSGVLAGLWKIGRAHV